MNLVRHRAFSLLELVVVLALLTSAMALLAPRLSGFFRGRHLDDEARRLWALTRYAQELAITRALPVAVWVDSEERTYGLEAEPGYGYTVSALRYDLGPDVEVSAETSAETTPGEHQVRLVWWPDGTLAEGSATTWQLRHRRLPGIVWELQRDAQLSTFTLVRENSG